MGELISRRVLHLTHIQLVWHLKSVIDYRCSERGASGIATDHLLTTERLPIMLRELMERAEEVLNTFATVEREARALADGLVAEADLDSQVKLFLAESYEPVEPIVFARNNRKADRVAYLHVLASEAMSARVYALHLLNEMRAAGASAKDFAFALHTVDESDSLTRRLEECRKDIEADNEQFGK